MEATSEAKRTISINWRNLLRLAVAGDLVILAYMYLVYRDTLAVALATIFLIGLALMRFRGGQLGLLLVGLLSADITIWTASGAVNNFLNGEQFSALILPGYLGAMSLIGCISAVGTWRARHDPERGGRQATLVAQIGLVLLLAVTASSFLLRPAAPVSAAAVDIDLKSQNMSFSQTELSSTNGGVTVRLANDDLWWHTFTIDELGVNLSVPMGAERQITFDAPPGTYDFYCAIPGHEAAGMHGTITIGE